MGKGTASALLGACWGQSRISEKWRSRVEKGDAIVARVVRGWVDREALGKALKLSDHQKIMLAQTVGYPEDEGR